MPKKSKEIEDPKDFTPNLTDLKGIGTDSADKIIDFGIATIQELAQTPSIILRSLGLKNVDKLLFDAREYCKLNKLHTANEIIPKWKLPTGVKLLDAAIGGGIESQVITECFGPFASGKTQTAQTLAIKALELGGEAIYIDTENQVRPERLSQIMEAHNIKPEEGLKKIWMVAALNSDHQRSIVKWQVPDLARNHPIKILVIDSIMAHFGAEYVGRAFLAERQQTLNQHIYEILRIARTFDFPVVITNQVRSKPDVFLPPPYNMEATGGNIIAHSSSLRLMLRKGQSSKEGNRVATLMDSSSNPYGEAPFRITGRGIEDCEE